MPFQNFFCNFSISSCIIIFFFTGAFPMTCKHASKLAYKYTSFKLMLSWPHSSLDPNPASISYPFTANLFKDIYTHCPHFLTLDFVSYPITTPLMANYEDQNWLYLAEIIGRFSVLILLSQVQLAIVPPQNTFSSRFCAPLTPVAFSHFPGIPFLVFFVGIS